MCCLLGKFCPGQVRDEALEHALWKLYYRAERPQLLT